LTSPAGALAPGAWVPPAEPAPFRSTAPRWWANAVIVVVAVGCAVAAVPVYRHGIAANPFPSYVQGDPSYQIDHYSAPWIAGGICLAGLAAILLIVTVGRLWQGRTKAVQVGGAVEY
jgi:hypothetical protein